MGDAVIEQGALDADEEQYLLDLAKLETGEPSLQKPPPTKTD